jgi:cyclopropane fatty-acyl-phospholipid synthase-like methyltransferase
MGPRPFSQACENNKHAILDVLRIELAGAAGVLEIGSGTGQHARFFAERLPGLRWQASDLAANLAGIESWREGYSGDNLPAPAELDVRDDDWSIPVPDAVFTANSLHIMAWAGVRALFRGLARHAPAASRLLVYGPFNYGGKYTSESNARFDSWLAGQHPDSAIRDFEAVDALAAAAGYDLHADHTMPANNRLLVWRRTPA